MATFGGALLALVGCFPQFGEYDGNAAGSAEGGKSGHVTSGGGGGGPLPPSCGNDGFCIEVPVGWEGPVALTQPRGACGGAYGRQVATGETDVAGEPASCKCDCGAAFGSTCPTAVVTRYFGDGCTNQLDVTNVPAAGCAAISTQNAGSWQATAAAVGGSCPAIDMAATPAVVFDDRVVCAADAPPTCEGGEACAPRPGDGFEPRICIMEDGDVDCTSPSFAMKTLVFSEGHEDMRHCDVPCACQPPSATCGGSVSGLQGAACGAAQDGVLVDGSCDDGYVGSNGSFRYFATLTTEGTCDPVPRTSVGEVVGLAPITLCCSGVL